MVQSLRARGARGFTLIELMVVIVVLAILTGIAMVKISDMRTQAKRTILVNSVRTGLLQQELFNAEHGRYANAQELAVFSGGDLGAVVLPNAPSLDLRKSSGWDEGVGIYLEYGPTWKTMGAAFEERPEIVCQWRSGVFNGQQLEKHIACLQFNSSGALIADERNGDKIRF